MEDELAHFIRRSSDARVMAQAAAGDRIRNIHLELARNYDLLAADIRREIDIRDAGPEADSA